MTKRSSAALSVEWIEVPTEIRQLALRRTAGMRQMAVYRDDISIAQLTASAYVQGLNDGYDAKESEPSEPEGR